MPPYEDSEIPEPISRQLLDIRQRLKDLQVNDAARELNDTRHRMKDPFEVLRKKELELCRVRQEVESLRLVIPLLVEDMEETEPTSPSSTTQDADAVTRKAAQLVPAAQDSTAGRRNGWLPGKLLDLS